VGPARYAHVAGWEPTIMGRRDLYHNHCLAILPAEGSQQPCGALQLLQEAGERCPWCNAELIFLVVLDLSAPFFRFLGFEGPILPVLTCEFCTCYQTVFAEIGIDGSSHWFAGNQRPKWLSEDVENWKRGPWQHVVVRLTPRRGIYATDWCMAGTTSQIGGLPSWVQDAEYPVCPKCAKTMTFIGELDNGHFPGHEGIYYAFFCAACRMTATSYQQT